MVVEEVSANLRRLLDTMGWSEHDLARRSNVSQKAINNLLNKFTGCTITTAHKLAAPFGLTGWQIQLPNVNAEAGLNDKLDIVIRKFLKTDQKGREFIMSAIERT